MKDLRDLKDLPIHDVKPIGDQSTIGRRHSLSDSTDHHWLELQQLHYEKTRWAGVPKDLHGHARLVVGAALRDVGDL